LRSDRGGLRDMAWLLVLVVDHLGGLQTRLLLVDHWLLHRLHNMLHRHNIFLLTLVNFPLNLALRFRQVRLLNILVLERHIPIDPLFVPVL
jgi:hypothetical protein